MPFFGNPLGSGNFSRPVSNIFENKPTDLSFSLEKYFDEETKFSRLEFLLSPDNSSVESAEEPKEEQYLKNKKEFKNALELLERGKPKQFWKTGRSSLF